jgi:hypothetical protein
MVAINFPDSPTNGQEHAGYVWDATNNVWNRLPTLPALDLINFSAVAPSNPQDGQFWFDTTVGKMYVYYNDGSSSQWVSAIGGLASQTGTTGQVLTYDGTEWVADDPAPTGPGDNLMYNGAMQVAQRGTSETGITTSGYYTADRWQLGLAGLGTWTQTVEADGPTGSGFVKSLKMECTTADAAPAANDIMTMNQRFEGQDLQGLKKGTSDAESLTLSFWVKSNVTGTYVVNVLDLDNTRSISQSYSVSSSGTWEKKTLTFAGDTTGAFDNDNGASLLVRWFLGAGTTYTSGTLGTSWASTVNGDIAAGQTNLAASTSNYWQVTGVQLEAGPVATSFEHKPYGVELAECQRYYYLHVDAASGTGERFIGIGIYTVSNRFRVPVSLPTTMRIIPSLEQTTGSGIYEFDGRASNGAFNAFTGLTLSNLNVVNLDIEGISGSDDSTFVYTTSPVNTGRIAFDAEL